MSTGPGLFIDEFKTSYDQRVEKCTQSSEYLAGTVHEIATSGMTFQLAIAGTGEYKEGSFTPDVIPATQLEIRHRTMSQAPFDYKNMFRKNANGLYYFDQMTPFVDSHGQAAGRFRDLLKVNTIANNLPAIFDADTEFDIEGGSHKIANTLDITGGTGAASKLSVDAFIDAIMMWGDLGVDTESGCSAWVRALDVGPIRKDPNFQNINFNRRDAADPSKNELKRLGFWSNIDIRTPSPALYGKDTTPDKGKTKRSMYFVRKDAIWVGWNEHPHTEITYDGANGRYIILSQAVAGSMVVKPEGIFRLIYNV